MTERPDSAGKDAGREAAINAMFAAIDTAYTDALALHEAGRCHESEWSCSHCEEAGNE